MSVAGLAASIVQVDFEIENIVFAILGLVLLIPYYGYSYQKKFANHLLWKVTFFIQLFLTVIVFIVSSVALFFYVTGGGNFFIGFIGVFAALLFAVILLIPPFRYAFKEDKLWEGYI